jgi:hypothetical protein
MQENYVYIVALAPDLRVGYLYSKTKINFCSSIIELLLLLMLLERSYRSSKASHLYRKSSLALWLQWRATFMYNRDRGSGTSDRSE